VLARRGELGVTFIGHSSFFLQIGGKNILVDPNFARWIFILKRLRRPGLKLRELPPIDAVLVSHAHFDHLHRPSLRAIAWLTRRKTGKRPAIIVPRHVRDLVSDLGYGRVVELDWWQSFQLGKVEVTHVPSRHWGARIVRDTHRGFGGYVLRSGEHSIYHAGDTAYFDGFREIGERLKPEVALLPIGAYHPDSFRKVHTSPEDAIQAFLDLDARWMVPMHYGTFRLSYEPVDEPVERLKADAKRRGIEKKICVLEEGVTKFFE
jgi:L-ascorbate metabolism protein UlaG (beta-lactamase superfamily)